MARLSGYHNPADSIGPEPAAAVPDLRAAWHEALAALGPVEGVAILQSPEPEIPPSPQILERMMDYDADWEAAD
jgi:hypothetical protein